MCRLLHRFLRTSVPIPYGEREHQLSRSHFHGVVSCRLSLLSIPGALITMLVLGRIEYERESEGFPLGRVHKLRPRTPGALFPFGNACDDVDGGVALFGPLGWLAHQAVQ